VTVDFGGGARRRVRGGLCGAGARALRCQLGKSEVSLPLQVVAGARA
jgi:hypothetical protein